MLRAGLYDVAVPEEAALPVVCWLVDNGHADAARALVETLAPFFGRLRFYPTPAERPVRTDSRVFVQDVGRTIESLRAVRPNPHLLAQQEAVRVWAPLYDRAVALFLETVEGDAPDLARDPGGERLPRQNGKFPVVGGWPCQKYPPGWADRARALLREYARLRKDHRRSGRPDRPDDSFAPLRDCLRRCADDPRSLSGRDVGKVRLILARYVAARGTPDSQRCRDARGRQAADVAGPAFTDVAAALVPRLQAYPEDDGVEDLDALTRPVSPAEAGSSPGVAPGTELPPSLRRKVERCLCDTAEALVKRGIITSGDTLARVLPQMTGGTSAAGIDDPALRRLYALTYRAFRRRRSLLLLNLESQVKITELPWVAAVEGFRKGGTSRHASPGASHGQSLAARAALREIALTTLVSFPQAVVPNKLVREMAALAKDAGLDLPLVEEVAADIFMGRFSGKFVAAAKRGAELLDGTLYAAYYGIDYRPVREMVVPVKEDEAGAPRVPPGTGPDEFARLCFARAGVDPGAGRRVADNGTVLEQQQILTSQNLAVLVRGLDLQDALRDHLPEMARSCFRWVCARLQVKASRGHAKLIALKNSAYAWRQMIFYLALMPQAEVRAFLSWAAEHLSKQRHPFPSRFAPALRGLELAADGVHPGNSGRKGAQQFLGWTTRKHWLMD